jgi:hypothetical protein
LTGIAKGSAAPSSNPSGSHGSGGGIKGALQSIAQFNLFDEPSQSDRGAKQRKSRKDHDSDLTSI